MKKLSVSLAAVAIAASISAYAEPQNNFTVGYSRSTVDVMNLEFPDNPQGFNIKYRHDFTSEYGIIGSFTYSGLDEYYNSILGSSRLILDYYSYTVGPTLRANKYFSVYGLVGAATGKASGDYNIAGYRGAESIDQTEFSYGGGLQIDVNENLTLDASFEYTKFDEVEARTITIGAGYRF
ncbi:Ail/Lom family outer membrane beta-barrel protein [Vibrio cholerae]